MSQNLATPNNLRQRALLAARLVRLKQLLGSAMIDEISAHGPQWFGQMAETQELFLRARRGEGKADLWAAVLHDLATAVEADNEAEQGAMRDLWATYPVPETYTDALVTIGHMAEQLDLARQRIRQLEAMAPAQVPVEPPANAMA